MVDSRKDKLVGPVISLPTFIDDEHNLLPDRQRKHIRWLIDSGIRAGSGVLMVAGGYGESYFLEDEELEALVDVLADEAGGEVPTMVGVFELSARRAARKARYAADAGIDFVELGMPHYSLPSEEDVFLHHQYVSDNADIGIMTYNNYWVMPGTREISRGLLERYVELDNMVGVKWVSASEAHYVGMVRLFRDELNFIDNRMVMATGARHGMKGFVDFYGNVAPRLSLRLWDLMREGGYDELDDLLMAVHFDPMTTLTTADAPGFAGMGDGPQGKLRWSILGLETGPVFPAQALPSKEFVEHTRKIMEAPGGVREWVDWDQSILE